MIRALFFLTVAAIGKAEIYDVTTIYRLNESNYGTPRETLTIPICYSGSDTCVWQSSGLVVDMISEREISQYQHYTLSHSITGLKLTEDRGTLVSPNMVTTKSSRLCLQVSATRGVSIKVSAMFNHGPSLDLGETHGQGMDNPSETVTWGFLADLSSYKEQTFNLHVEVLGIPSSAMVRGVSSCASSSANRTIVVRDPSIGEVHARGNARGHEYRLPNDTKAGSNANQTFRECKAVPDRCDSWSVDYNSWTGEITEYVNYIPFLGSLVFSLNSTQSTIKGTFTSISDQLCLELNYFMDSVDEENDVQITGESGTSVFTLKREPKQLQAGDWAKVKYTLNMPDISLQGHTVHIAINCTKTPKNRLLFRRISDCIQGEEDITVLFEDVGFTAPGRGANVANIDKEPAALTSRKTCFNGGKFYENHGCDCPPGFKGTSCEEGCGPNRYGADCGGECSETTRECRGMVMCRPMLGCDCAAGYTGPFCDEPCTGKNYGASCKQTCGHCAAGLACDIYTGVCLQGCEPGYQLPYCLEGNPQLSLKPEVHNKTSTSATVLINVRNMTGPGKPMYFQLQYKTQDSLQWLQQEKNKIPEKPATLENAGVLRNLEPGSTYVVRVVLFDKSVDMYQKENLQETSFVTDCKLPDYIDYNLQVYSSQHENVLSVNWQLVGDGAEECIVTGYEIHISKRWRWTVYTINKSSLTEPCTYTIHGLLAGSQYRVKIRAMTNQGPMPFSETVLSDFVGIEKPFEVSNILVKEQAEEGNTYLVVWDAPRSYTTVAAKIFTIIIECVHYISCPHISCSDRIMQRGALSSTVYTGNKDMLLSHALYNISVAAVAHNDYLAVQGRWSSILYATGQGVPATSPTKGMQLPSKNKTTLRVQWEPPSANRCDRVNGAIVAYRCQLISEDRREVEQELNTTQLFIKFENLRPNFRYIVNVFVVTSKGWNEREFLSIPAKTGGPRLPVM